MKLLCAGDLHIGRRSSRVPDAGNGIRLSAGECWRQIVEHAITNRVDAMLLSGDLVDRQNRFFEAVGPLQRGLQRLGDAEIPVIAVAGNHDFDVLPAIADALGGDAFLLLGRDGRWQTELVATASGPLRVAGWSFPREHFTGNPLTGLTLPEDGVSTVGLLHCDLDASAASTYAPVPAKALRAHPVDLWLLGHIHAPGLRRDELPPLLYPGSPQALDPGETGPHGAWIVEMSTESMPSAELLPFSTVRYDTVEVCADECDDPLGVRETVVQALQAHQQMAADAGPLRHLSCRVRISGRTRAHGGIAEALKDLQDLELGDDRLTLTVERVSVDTRPAVDLNALAATPNACGLLSRFVLALDAGNVGEFEELIAAARGEARRVYLSSHFPVVGAAPPEGAALHALLRQQALQLLDTLISQKEAGA